MIKEGIKKTIDMINHQQAMVRQKAHKPTASELMDIAEQKYREQIHAGVKGLPKFGVKR